MFFDSRRPRSHFMMKKAIATLMMFFFSGSLVFCAPDERIVQERGAGKVRLIQYDDGQWQMLVDGAPYFIKGVVYEPVKIGERLKASNTWMHYDFNNNGRPDTAYDAWVDANANNVQDETEKAVGDFQLLKEMGCNTIRIYHPVNIRKEGLRDLFERYGIRVMMGHFLGAYTWGSGASWDKGTDYTDPVQRQRMMDDVKKMVLEHKDEPYVLFWMLGNENEMRGSEENSTFNNTNARLYPQAYTAFVNDVAAMIHVLDPNHPVGISNASMFMMKYYDKNTPEIDIVGMNAYMGPHGFGTMWRAIQMDFDRPVVITEYGVDCYNQVKKCIDEDFQAKYYRGCWKDMVKNGFGGGGAGNSLGGFAYNWLDSWWFCGSPSEHDTEKGAWRGPANDAWMNDEWMAVCSQGDGKQSPFMRQLRKVYFMFQKEWTS